MTAYGRYVRIFFGVLLMIPLLIVVSKAEALIVGIFVAVAIACAIAGFSLIVKAAAAPSLEEASDTPKRKEASPS